MKLSGKKAKRKSLRRLRNCICGLMLTAVCWNYLVCYGAVPGPLSLLQQENPEYTEMILPEGDVPAVEAGAPASGQEGYPGEELPVPEILSWIIWDVPHIYQYDSYPTGCESVSAVCALRYSGEDISVDTFIDQYLSRGVLEENAEGSLTGPSLDDAFIGDPRTVHGCGCNAPVIVEAAGRVLEGTDRKIRNLTGTGLSTLCREYISRDIPVILWATIQMQAWTNTITWTDEVKGDTVTFYTAEHCLVLMGFDEENYYFSDPASESEITAYDRASVEAAYEKLGKQAAAVVPADRELLRE